MTLELETTCPPCNGSGSVLSAECLNCNGKGIVLTEDGQAIAALIQRILAERDETQADRDYYADRRREDLADLRRRLDDRRRPRDNKASARARVLFEVQI